LILSVVL